MRPGRMGGLMRPRSGAGIGPRRQNFSRSLPVDLEKREMPSCQCPLEVVLNLPNPDTSYSPRQTTTLQSRFGVGDCRRNDDLSWIEVISAIVTVTSCGLNF